MFLFEHPFVLIIEPSNVENVVPALSVCVCVCVYVCVRVCVCMCVYMCVYVYVYMYVCMCACNMSHTYILTYKHAHIHLLYTHRVYKFCYFHL